MEAHNSTPNPEQEPEVVDIPGRGGFLALTKNLLILLLLIAVIVGSFWISFSLGKRLLVPVKKLPQQKIEAEMPQQPDALAALEEFAEIAQEEEVPAAEVVKTAEPQPQPVAPTRTVTAPVPSGSKYYKVQAGVFAIQSNAYNLAKKLEANGFDTYIKKVRLGWRVQVGAYFNKKWALNQQRKLKEKGFESVLIYE